MPLIEPGQTAPDFELKDQNGKTHRLSDQTGHPVVLFFYPKDMTSGCTLEARSFQSNLSKFKRRGVRVFGISILSEKSKAKFAEKEGIKFPLLADDHTNAAGKPDPQVAQRYGVWIEKSMYGRKYMGIVRTTYLIDADARVVRRWDKVKVPGHVEEVLEATRELA